MGGGCLCEEAAPGSLGFSVWGWGTGCASEDLAASEQGSSTRNPDIFTWTVRAMSLLVIDVVVGIGRGCSQVSGVWWLSLGCRMCLPGPPKEQGSPIRNSGTPLSTGSQGHGSSDQRGNGG